VDLSDLQRLAKTTLFLVVALLAWLVFLALHDAGQFEWTWPERGLSWFGMTAWLWTGAALLALMALALAFMSFGINQAPEGFAKGKLRQVQCQDCKAVFFVHDAGNRPLTHLCPNCKALGVYDGMAPPVGVPPKAIPPEKVVALSLTCHACEHRFNVTDSGVRPLKVACPMCDATGTIS